MERICISCKKTFNFRACPTDIATGRGKFCSRPCLTGWRNLNSKTKTVSCLHCKKDYEKPLSRLSRTRFCSKPCQYKWQSENKRGNNHPRWVRETRTCLICFKLFTKNQYQLKNGEGKYCSKECLGIRNSLENRGENNPSWNSTKIECSTCKKSYYEIAFNLKKNKNHFCSVKCYGLWQRENRRGDKSRSWQGGKTKLSQTIRTSTQYLEWRNAIYKRDNYTCQHCGERGRELNADHIVPFSEIIKENNIDSFLKASNCGFLWSLDNGRTLCIDCHRLTVTYGPKQVKRLNRSPVLLTP